MTDNQKKWTKFLKAAGIRALWTIAEAASGYITIGMAISDVNWKMMLSVSCVAGLYSIFKSVLTGLPEVKDALKEEDEDDKSDT